MTTSVRGADSDAAYQIVARELRTEILQGRYRDGTRLPTEAELTDRYHVSRQTIRRAFQDLVSEGVVYRVPGRGTFVAGRDGQYIRQVGSIEDLMSLSVDTIMEVVSPLQRRIDVETAGRLRLRADVVYNVVFRRLYDDTPFCLTTVSLPPDLAVRLAGVADIAEVDRRSHITIIGLLDTKLGLMVTEAEQSIIATSATTRIADALGCRAGHPVLRIDRLYMVDGDPVELAVSYFLPEHYSYRVRLRRSVP